MCNIVNSHFASIYLYDVLQLRYSNGECLNYILELVVLTGISFHTRTERLHTAPLHNIRRRTGKRDYLIIVVVVVADGGGTKSVERCSFLTELGRNLCQIAAQYF